MRHEVSDRELAESASRPLPSTTYIRKALPQALGTWELLALFVLAVFWVINAPGAAMAGPFGLSCWLLGAAFFFGPSVLATAQLGALFPDAGALYGWTARTFGRYWAVLVGACSWIVGPLAQLIAGSAFVTILQGLNPGWLSAPWQQGVALLGFISGVSVLSCQPVRTLLPMLKVLAALVLLVVLLLVAAGAFWLSDGHASATDFRSVSAWLPTTGSFGTFGLITLGYLGASIPLHPGAEMVSRRAIVRHQGWGMLLVVAGYLLATLALLVVRGASALQTSSQPNAEVLFTIAQVLHAPFGSLAAICLLAFLLGAAMTYQLAASRLLLAGAIDGHLPVFFGRLTVAARVPRNALVVQSLCAAGLTGVLFFLLPPALSALGLGTPGNLANDAYTVTLASLTLIWLLATLFLFLVLGRVAWQAERIHLLAPRWLLLAAAGIGFASCVAVIVATLSASWLPAQISDGTWLVAVSSLTASCLTGFAILGQFVTGQAAWQRLQRLEA